MKAKIKNPSRKRKTAKKKRPAKRRTITRYVTVKSKKRRSPVMAKKRVKRHTARKRRVYANPIVRRRRRVKRNPGFGGVLVNGAITAATALASIWGTKLIVNAISGSGAQQLTSEKKKQYGNIIRVVLALVGAFALPKASAKFGESAAAGLMTAAVFGVAGTAIGVSLDGYDSQISTLPPIDEVIGEIDYSNNDFSALGYESDYGEMIDGVDVNGVAVAGYA